MPVYRSQDDLEFLIRTDRAYRAGDTQEAIATAEGLAGVNSIRVKVHRLGFCFTRDGGLRLVDTMMKRDLTDWLETGELAAAPDETTVAA